MKSLLFLVLLSVFFFASELFPMGVQIEHAKEKKCYALKFTKAGQYVGGFAGAIGGLCGFCILGRFFSQKYTNQEANDQCFIPVEPFFVMPEVFAVSSYITSRFVGKLFGVCGSLIDCCSNSHVFDESEDEGKS